MATGFSSRSELDSLEGKKISPLKSWSKQIGRWFKAQRRVMVDRRLKRQLLSLEKQRLKEKTDVTERRRLYERLFKRRLKETAKLIPTPPVVPPAPRPHSETITPPLPARVTAVIETANNFEAKPVPVPVPTPVSEPELEAVITPPPPAPHIPEKKVPSVTKKTKAHFTFISRFFSKHSKSLVHKLAQEREEELTWQEKNEVERRFWQPYKGVKPNLIKDQGTVFFNWHEHMLILALSLVLCCLTIGLVYVGLLIWEKERLDNNRATVLNTQVIDAEIMKSEKDIVEVQGFNEKLKTVSSLLDNHVYWTNFISFLEDNTLKEVYYERFKGDLSGKYVIPAVARNLESVSLELNVIKSNDKVKDVSYDTGQGRATTETVRFNLGLTVDPKIFTK